jgi:hypothetical protein
MTKKNETLNLVSHLLKTDATFALELLTFLLKAQTSDERRDQTTRHPNQQGFNVVHAKRFTKLAQDALERGYLTAEELTLALAPDKHGRLALSCYWRQAATLLERRTIIGLTKIPIRRELLLEITEEVKAS